MLACRVPQVCGRVDGDFGCRKSQLLGGRAGCLGADFGASYSLWMFKRVYLGPVGNDHVKELTDINAREFLVMAVLAAMVLYMWVFTPNPLRMC